MVGKVLTTIPLLVLSGLFFAAGIVEGGVMFLAFALMMAWALLRGDTEAPPTSRGEALDVQTRAGPGPGAGDAGH
jgi:hypothetical protein